jgi:phenylalanyl-tRNA synthetase beta chain
MRVSLAWIKRLLAVQDLGMNEAELQAKIALSVCEIEGAERTMSHLDGVVVGRVLTCGPHPNAERLRLTTVDVGAAQPLSIVCGAANVAAGLTVAVATIGTTLHTVDSGGQAKSFTIKAAKLRGEPSEGMICAEDELGLGTGHAGILELAADLVPGTPLARALGLGDTVWVIENHAITHRPDLWGHLGWAREVAAATGKATAPPPDIGWQARGSGWSVSVHDEGCTSYFGAVVENVRNGESPKWMADLLSAAGVRPLSLLVDITNFVMLELGEPMHAFDLRQLPGKQVTVRAARDQERFTTLDQVERSLSAGDLLICDGDTPLALGGIMGGVNSMIQNDTTSILLEAAIFRPDRIRRTRQRTGLASDASARFEKGLYAELAPAAINRALALLEEIIPSCRITNRFHHGPHAQPELSLRFDPGHVGRLTGLAVDPSTQRGILERLGFHPQGDVVQIPWWRRKDVRVPVDLVEEIARHHGYDRIEPAIPRLPAAAPPPNLLSRTSQRARRSLSAQGWDEVATYAFTSERWTSVLQDDPAVLIRLEHPLSSEQTVLRPTLVGGLVEAVVRNRRHLATVRIYEIGKRYARGIGLTQCGEQVGAGGFSDEVLVCAGMYAEDGQETPFYGARDAAQTVLRELGYGEELTLAPPPMVPSWLTPARTLALFSRRERTPVGIIGELAQSVRSSADSQGPIAYFELALESLVRRHGLPKPVRFQPPSRFMRVEREFTWVSPEAVTFEQLASATERAAGELSCGVELVTIYRGDPIPAGQKALSLRLALQSSKRTLEEQELNQISQRVISGVIRDTGAQLRA